MHTAAITESPCCHPESPRAVSETRYPSRLNWAPLALAVLALAGCSDAEGTDAEGVTPPAVPAASSPSVDEDALPVATSGSDGLTLPPALPGVGGMAPVPGSVPAAVSAPAPAPVPAPASMPAASSAMSEVAVTMPAAPPMPSPPVQPERSAAVPTPPVLPPPASPVSTVPASGVGGAAPVVGNPGMPMQTPSTAPADSAPPSELVGWATSQECGPKGTTGGGSGPPTVVVTNSVELLAGLNLEGPTVIEVQGRMDGLRIKEGAGVKDKTLIGTNDAFISGGFRIDRGHNLIFKNIRFGEGAVVNGDDNRADGFTVHNTTCVWIDHCEFTNSIDGNLDLVGGDGYMTAWVTVSWSKFWYDADYAAQINPDHRFSNLVVGSDDKPDPLPYVTYHHNWWAENVTERMPRGRWGWVHVFNNYYSTQGNNYGIGASTGIQYVVENNFFEPGFEDPVYFFNTDKGVAVSLSGNQMDGVIWKDTKPEEASLGTPFNPAAHYRYTLQSPEEAKASVMAHAGRR